MAITGISNPSSVISLFSLPGGTSVSYTGDAGAIGKGSPTLANFPSLLFSDFLVMSTGYVSSIIGANSSGSQGTDLGAGGTTGDKATLVLNIPVPTLASGTAASSISFDFTFLSEEYPEYVGSQFNDYFSLKINGVEVARDTSNKPISVNNNFFTSAFSPTGTMFDGQTPPLTASAGIAAGTKQVQVVMEIADVGDGIYDSAVFLNNLTFHYPQTVFVDFDGGSAIFSHGASRGSSVTFAGLAANVATEQFKTDVLNVLNNTVYKDFNITFTATKPTSGEYATILVGGAGDRAKLPASFTTSNGTTGKAEHIDVGNKYLSDLAVVLTENFGGPVTAASLAQTIGHEMGHLLGLFHVSDAGQIMYYAKNNSLLVGQDSPLAHMPNVKQDSYLELASSTGLKSGAVLGQQGDLASKTLAMNGVASFDTFTGGNQTLYEAVVEVQLADSPSVFVEIGHLNSGATNKFAGILNLNGQIVLHAKTVEGGNYDIISDPVSISAQSGSTLQDVINNLTLKNKTTGASVGSLETEISSDAIYKQGLSVQDLLSKPASETMQYLKDFDGALLGRHENWLIKADTDVQGDGDKEYILFNRELGRWATVGPDSNGMIDFIDHSWGGDTRVVGLYIDPLVGSGVVEKGSDHDSQRRFQNDLIIDNIATVVDANDYDGDGLQELYFTLTDKTAVLHAYMHADGNIQYANYQSFEQMAEYLKANGFSSEYYAGWLV